MLLRVLLSAAAGLLVLNATEHQGVVTFNGIPVPGATVQATAAQQQPKATVTNRDGAYVLDLADANWTVRVEMQCFVPAEKPVTGGGPPSEWNLELLPDGELAKISTAAPRLLLQQSTATAKPEPKDNTKSAAAPDPAPEDSHFAQQAADGFLINGSPNNGAASPFALAKAFGNARSGPQPLYNGNLGVSFDNSMFDARAYSLTGQNTAKPSYDRFQGLFAFGGPLKIPYLLKRNGPNFTINYQWTRNTNATTEAGVVPTLEQREGAISPQARALLALYPLPNFTNANSRYNYQIPLVSGLHQDNLQLRANKQIRQRDSVAGSFSGQSTRTGNTNLFGFLDTGRTSGINTSLQWRHSFSQRFHGTIEYRYTRFTNRLTPYFANRENISGQAGISGNDQSAANWGPPTLRFTSGITSLHDAPFSLTRNQTQAISYGAYWNRGPHNLQFGAGSGRQQFNLLAQQDPRGAFTFTGPDDFAHFLQGLPDASSIAFGNADKYLRSHSANAYVVDDWHQRPGLTINLGLRWEYWSPATEKYNRLVNLAIGPKFTSATPRIPASLEPNRAGFSPRAALSWRPLLAESTVLRASYGLYYDTNIYEPIALQLAQQAPLSKSLRIQNSPETPLTLANGFPAAAGLPTFAVDPHFRLGYSQTWQMSVQRDLAGALQMVLGYTGTKGTNAQQAFLPNTYAPGAISPCEACPAGFTYLTSNGKSIRNAAQVQLRRRLGSGFTAQLQYTFAKSLDDATLGGASPGNVLVAQNWLDLRAERARSNFDQRHLLSLQSQYTSGMGLGGGTLLNGWRGRLLKEWTLASQVTLGTGLPLTAIYPALIPGTGVTGSLRPDYTGAPLFAGNYLNPAAFAPPASGHWGNAGRNSITGPAQFTMLASAGRTFRATDKISLDVRIDATNPINHVTYTAWNTVVTNQQFGLPAGANAMRSLQTTVRVRF